MLKVTQQQISALQQLAAGLGKTIRYIENPQYHQTTLEHVVSLDRLIPLLVRQMESDNGINLAHLDPNLVRAITFAHDIGELGMQKDFTAYAVWENGDLAIVKDTIERQKVKKLAKQHGRFVFDLWHSYQEKATPEARLVKFADKIEGKAHVLKCGIQHAIDQSDADVTAGYGRKDIVREGALIYKRIQETLKEEYGWHGWAWHPQNNVNPDDFRDAPSLLEL